MHRSEATPVFLFDRCSICATKGAISRRNFGKRTKRKRRQTKKDKETPKPWKGVAAAECNSFEYNSDGSGSGLQFFNFPTRKRVGAI